MIKGVRCSESSFREVAFEDGFNVILADRTKEATKKDTRNGLGKSTLIEIIHFCLGGSISKERLGSESLSGWTFFLDLTFQSTALTVSRNTANPAKVFVEGDTSILPVAPRLNEKTRQLELRSREWRDCLGTLMFDLPLESGHEYAPTSRGLISYFIRRGRDAFSTPFEHFRKQREIDKQVFNLFLLGLDWTYASEWQVLKDKMKTLESLKSAARAGLINSVLGSLGELEALKVRLRAQVSESSEYLRTFRVHPRYRELEESANRLTAAIHELSNSIIADTRLLEFYQASVHDETAPEEQALLDVYAEAGATMPELVRRRLEEVRHFHDTILQNRRSFLEGEVRALSRTIEANRRLVKEKTEERAKLLEVLQTHGALEEYSKLQDHHTQIAVRLADTENRIQSLKDFEQGKSALSIDQELLHQRARQDLEERHSQVSRAISHFNSNSQGLYEAPGNLVLDIQSTGYRFNVEIERSGSQGIDSMKVFCYDLMLAQLWAARSPSPGFLIHDSTLMDGVDERQVALALELAAKESESRKFQYICTLNSDALPLRDFSEQFDIHDYVRLTLTDATEDGCLLGLRF